MKDLFTLHSLILILLLSVSTGIRAQDCLTFGLSVKIILDPSNGTPPPSFSFEKLDSIVSNMNLILDSNQSNYRFYLSEVKFIGGINDSISINHYDERLAGNRDSLENYAQNSPKAYQWSEKNINIYYNNTTLGNLSGASSFPYYVFDEIIYMRMLDGFNAITLLHEIGHFFNLSHTHQGDTGDCSTDPPDLWIPGNLDGVPETLADHQCWTNINQMSLFHYGVLFRETALLEQDSIRNTYRNIMSYHSDRRILTPTQFVRWKNAVNNYQTRRDVICNHCYMQEFYLQLNGPQWTQNTHWLDSCDICQWEGITCDLNGEVIAMDLADNNLDGFLSPSALRKLAENLPYLKTVNLMGNNIKTQDRMNGEKNNLHLFSQFPNLEALYLSNNDSLALRWIPGSDFELLSIPIPFVWGETWTNMKDLRLVNCGFSGALPSSIGNLSSLETLNAGQNNLSGPIPASIAALPNLQKLRLPKNQLDGPIHFEFGLNPNLNTLLLNDNLLDGCLQSSLKNLCGQNINFSENPSMGIFSFQDFCNDTYISNNCEVDCTADDVESYMGVLPPIIFANGVNILGRATIIGSSKVFAHDMVSINPTFEVSSGQTFLIEMGCPY